MIAAKSIFSLVCIINNSRPIKTNNTAFKISSTSSQIYQYTQQLRLTFLIFLPWFPVINPAGHEGRNMYEMSESAST
jgi:hypothetical protein